MIKTTNYIRIREKILHQIKNICKMSVVNILLKEKYSKTSILTINTDVDYSVDSNLCEGKKFFNSSFQKNTLTINR